MAPAVSVVGPTVPPDTEFVCLNTVPSSRMPASAVYVVSFAAMVILSFVASGVMVTLLPAASVNVSVFVSAATVTSPTFTFENAFWLTSAPVAMPSSFVLSAADMTPSWDCDADWMVFLVAVITPLASCDMVAIAVMVVPDADGSETAVCLVLRSPRSTNFFNVGVSVLPLSFTAWIAVYALSSANCTSESMSDAGIPPLGLEYLPFARSYALFTELGVAAVVVLVDEVEFSSCTSPFCDVVPDWISE